MNSQNHEIPQNVRMGLVSFRERAFYKAHEYFEEAWRETDGPKREFFRILLHISGGFFRLSQEKPHAARKFFEHALKWLTTFDSGFYGFDLEHIQETIRKMLSDIEANTHPKSIIEKYIMSIIPDQKEIRL